jgi:nucleoside 2-deoxyribosyltransferase
MRKNVIAITSAAPAVWHCYAAQDRINDRSAGAPHDECFGTDGQDAPDQRPPDAATIYNGNITRITQADAVVADISAFRGPHMDPGTAMEIGFAAALGKPVFAYTSSPGPLIRRISCEKTDTGWRDAQGNLVEDFGLPDNLMIASTLAAPVSLQASEAIEAAARMLQSVRQKDHER